MRHVFGIFIHQVAQEFGQLALPLDEVESGQLRVVEKPPLFGRSRRERGYWPGSATFVQIGDHRSIATFSGSHRWPVGDQTAHHQRLCRRTDVFVKFSKTGFTGFDNRCWLGQPSHAFTIALPC